MSNFQTTNFFAIAKAHTSPQDDPFLGIHTFRYAQHVSSKWRTMIIDQMRQQLIRR